MLFLMLVANVIVGSGDKKDKFFKPQSKRVEHFQVFFPGKVTKTGLSLQFQVPRVFRRSKVLLRIVPPSSDTSLLMSKDPEFCKRVAGLERMLLVKANIATTPGVFVRTRSGCGFPGFFWLR